MRPVVLDQAVGRHAVVTLGPRFERLQPQPALGGHHVGRVGTGGEPVDVDGQLAGAGPDGPQLRLTCVAVRLRALAISLRAEHRRLDAPQGVLRGAADPRGCPGVLRASLQHHCLPVPGLPLAPGRLLQRCRPAAQSAGPFLPGAYGEARLHLLRPGRRGVDGPGVARGRRDGVGGAVLDGGQAVLDIGEDGEVVCPGLLGALACLLQPGDLRLLRPQLGGQQGQLLRQADHPGVAVVQRHQCGRHLDARGLDVGAGAVELETEPLLLVLRPGVERLRVVVGGLGLEQGRGAPGAADRPGGSEQVTLVGHRPQSG